MKHIPLLMIGAALVLTAQTQDGLAVPVPPPPGVSHAQTIEFVQNEFGTVGPVVKNAPYTAEAVNEHVQVLADGNRIVHKDSSQVARDSEGRTRRDLAIPNVGPLAANAPNVSVIYDPMANVSYTLDHKAKTARKMAGRGMVFHDTNHFGPGAAAAGVAAGVATAGVATAGVPPVGEEKRIVRMAVRGSTAHVGTGGDMLIDGPGPMLRIANKIGGKTESLGKQNIEGVLAEGTRTVDVIPAGEMGNERPIEIVSERWYSPELQAVVLTRHKDPRMGETTYKLVNIRRSEPLKSLFEVPADYTLKDSNSR